MNRTDAFGDLSPSGVPGEPTRTPEFGTAYVESRVSSTGGTESTTIDEVENAAQRAAERARDFADEARERTGAIRDRAEEIASRARSRVEGALDSAEDRLERAGVVDTIRDYPLVAAGLAFGIGFLIAGEGVRRRGGVRGLATSQLRKAVLGGLSAAMIQELRAMVDEHGGIGNVVSSIFGRNDEF